MKKYLFFVLTIGLGVRSFAQVKRAYDPDDSIAVEKSRSLAAGDSMALAVSAPWRWQQVDADFGTLPSSMHVFKTTDSLYGRPQLAYYVSVPLSEKSALFTSQVGYGKRYTPAQYYEQEGHPLLVINTSFFSFVTNGNLNLVVRDGKMLAWNQPSRRGKKDSI